MEAALPSLPTLIAFTLASLVLASSPGPDMTLFIGNTLSNGRRSGIATLLGTASGCLIHTLLAALGISVLIATSPTAFWLLKIVGALYLLWLAFQAITTGSTFAVDEKAPETKSVMNSYLMGIGINILNPKIVVFFITFLPQFVSAADPDAWKKTLFLGTYFVALTTPLLVCLILVADKLAARLRKNPKITRAIDWLFATVFATFAVRILMTEGR